jgi:hypothetical protein
MRCLHLPLLVMMQYELTSIHSSLLPLRVRLGTVTSPSLGLALSNGKFDVARVLIEAGADINALTT